LGTYSPTAPIGNIAGASVYQPSLLEQLALAMPDIPSPVANFIGGFGNGASFGLTTTILSAQGLSNYYDTNSTAYGVGNGAGTVTAVIATGGEGAAAATGETGLAVEGAGAAEGAATAEGAQATAAATNGTNATAAVATEGTAAGGAGTTASAATESAGASGTAAAEGAPAAGNTSVAGGATTEGGAVPTTGSAPQGTIANAENAAQNTVANPIPDNLARVTPGDTSYPTLGPPGDADVFVTDAKAIEGLNPAQISQKLTIPPSESYTVTEFETPQSGLASPINRTNPGFVGNGTTAGGAPEYVVPNGPRPEGATVTVIRTPKP
jgi:hypothetical protein